MKSRILFISFLGFIALLMLPGCFGKKGSSETTGNTMNMVSPISDSSDNMIMISSRDEQYANIKVDTVRFKNMAEYTILSGTTNLDERRVTVITSRVRGRVDKVFVRNPQQSVAVGEPLYAIYSEELLSDENEYVNALEQQAQFNTQQIAAQMAEGAKKKLLLWGVTVEQIKQLEQTRKPSALLTFYSNVSGTLTDLSVTEGQYVDAGTPLFRFADLSQLWIETQMYTSELQWLYQKPSITAEFDAYPSQIFSITPVFDNPTIEADQKISLVRFLVQNANMKLKPGMMAYVSIKRNEKKTIVIPKSSLLLGNMVTVWIKTGVGMYESRMIQLGIQNKKEVEVLSGLKAGELVVTSGAFLLNSALILKKGAGMQGMGGMKM